MRRSATLLSVVVALALGVGGLFVVAAGPANAYTAGSFKVSCTASHSAADDPIVLPNRPGASHLHDFFGNASTRASSTYESMDGVRSTCPSQDRSSYWVPALYQNGRKVAPAGVTVYYVSPVTDQSTIEAFPKNFRMIAGDAKNTDPAKMSGHIQWGCLGNTQIGRVVPASCPDADGIQARITFPSCWNGRWATNGGDNGPNMRYPSRNTCPPGFGRVFPTIRMNVAYRLGSTTGKVTLSSGNVGSIHADFLNVWDQATLAGLVRRCLHGKIDCAHLKGTTAGRAPAARPKVAAEPGPAEGRAPGASARPAAKPAAKSAGRGTVPAGPTPSTPAAASGAAAAPQVAAPGAPGGTDPGAPDPTTAGAAGPAAAEPASTWSESMKLVSDDGTLNAPAVTGAGLLLAGLLVIGTLLVRGSRRRVARTAPASGAPGRPGARTTGRRGLR